MKASYTFDEFVQYGLAKGAKPVNGMPWTFQFDGMPVTHENDNCYLIANGMLHGLRFMRGERLVYSANHAGWTVVAPSERPLEEIVAQPAATVIKPPSSVEKSLRDALVRKRAEFDGHESQIAELEEELACQRVFRDKLRAEIVEIEAFLG